MNAMAYHITMRPSADAGIARDTAERRTLARCMYACGEGRGLVAFRSVDTHLHAVVTGSREEAGCFARIVESALRRRLSMRYPFERARVREIETFRHLRSTLAYVFRQGEHHGLERYDPAHDASSLVDALGMRVIASSATTARLLDAAPRMSGAQLVGLLGFALDQEPEPIHYIAAGAAAVALPSLSGREVSARAARSAVAKLTEGKLPFGAIAEALGVSRRTLERDRMNNHPDLVLAIAKMARLHASVPSPYAGLVPIPGSPPANLHLGSDGDATERG